MSSNDEKVQEATLLFVSQLKQRPEQVVANVNCLLAEDGIKLELVHTRTTYQNPAEASLYDHLDKEGGA